MKMAEGIRKVEEGTFVFNSEGFLGDDGVRELSGGWGEDKQLTALYLSSSNIGVVAMGALTDALRASFSITSVDCSRNARIGDDGVALLAPALVTDGTGVSTIRELGLVRCAIGDIGATTLAKALAGNSVLDQLKLSGNFIGDAGAIALMGALVGTNKGSLGELWLSSNRIGTPGARGIASTLAKTPTLRELHLSGNTLRDEGVAALAQGAIVGGYLKGLYLGRCGVGDTGAKELANVLKGALHLESLCLGHNAITDDGASALARALSENQALRRLALPANDLRAAGGKAIAGMLLSNSALYHLDVSGNRLGSTGIEAVAGAIAKNMTLLELDLSECRGTDDSFRAVARAVENNKILGCLNYDRNHLGADTLAEIAYSMGRARWSARALVEQGVLPSVRLAPGQETSVPVAYGRKDNIVGSITVTNETYLEEARQYIDPLVRPHTSGGLGTRIGTAGISENAFSFVSNTGHVVPKEDERARRIVWDCELPVRLRPASWVPIGRV